eukprot:TRINITY_DN17476_c0_g1_i1.p1 TRINITY_DN17476_c0_g1~~TRINITY_DN17476_c0_g1_i1.p1  ORF type:complete len:585 (+),score=109.28 TRINITY_DN17476_c0_g1_i1:96-1850(+)
MARVLVRNGCLLTCSSRPSNAALHEYSWMLVDGGRIARVGTSEPPPELLDGATQLDAGGKVVLPGLGDSHCHVYATGRTLSSLSVAGCKSIAGLQEVLSKWARDHPAHTSGAVIQGTGWDQEELGALPSRWDLDAACPDRPVVLFRRCWHVLVANSAALRSCGVTAQSTKAGGVVDKRPDGEPTGILRESACGLVDAVINDPPPEAEQRRMLSAALKAMCARGITQCQTNDGAGTTPCSMWPRYVELADAEDLPMRVYLTVGWHDVRDRSCPPVGTRHQGGLLKMHRAKIYTDGALGPSTAALLEPYADDQSNTGTMQLSTEELHRAVSICSAAEFPVEVHVIGDRAADEALKAISSCSPLAPRPVLTHCQFLSQRLVGEMSRLGVIANVQPQFVPSDLPIVESRMGRDTERFRYAYAWRTLMKAGVLVAGGSDTPVEEPSPLKGIYDFVTHQLHASEKISFADALAAYTTASAYAAGEEDRLGQLRPGFEADFVLTSLDRTDVLASDPVALRRDDAIREVWLRGRRVYQAEGSIPRVPVEAHDGRGAAGEVPPWRQGRCPSCGLSHTLLGTEKPVRRLAASRL